MSKNGNGKNGNGKNGNGRKSFSNIFKEFTEGKNSLNTDSKKISLSIPANFGRYNTTEDIRKLKEKYPEFFKNHTVKEIIEATGRADPDEIEFHIIHHGNQPRD